MVGVEGMMIVQVTGAPHDKGRRRGRGMYLCIEVERVRAVAAVVTDKIKIIAAMIGTRRTDIKVQGLGPDSLPETGRKCPVTGAVTRTAVRGR